MPQCHLLCEEAHLHTIRSFIHPTENAPQSDGLLSAGLPVQLFLTKSYSSFSETVEFLLCLHDGRGPDTGRESGDRLM